MNTPNTMTKIGAAAHILQGIGAPVNQHTLAGMIGWMNAEGGNWGNNAAHNPLNTTLNAPGARGINSVGVKAYPNWGVGIAATVRTLRQPNMAGIVQAFHSSNPSLISHAIGNSPWGTSAGLVAKTIADAAGQRFAIPSMGGIANQMAQPAGPQTSTSLTPGSSSTDVGAALADSLLASSSHIDTSGKVSMASPLTVAANAVASGAYTTTQPSQAITRQIAGARAGASGSLRQGSFHPGLGKGDINPLGAGWVLGRTDEGVDANARVGTPIHALNDSKVVDIQPNWYKGQPLVLMQITSGKNAGKYWYVAEQINQHLHVGQFLTRGSVVATYAPSGTGIEIGWGHPGGGDTLAQATTGYTEGQATPAGASFRKLVA